jgi:hypothetical protein
MAQKIAKIALIILGFTIAFYFVSATFDGDFGWHLQFGQEAMTGSFPYLDTHTFTYFSQPWTNHEWGGDILFWTLYDGVGYLAIIALVALMIWLSFLLVIKIYWKKISITSLVVAIIGLLSVKFLFAPRLTLLSIIFFALTWYVMKNFTKKFWYLLPPVLWLWSAVHGSWILGFIVINIYIFGSLASAVLKKYLPKLAGRETNWTGKEYLTAIFVQIFSLTLIAINPYGLKIFDEIAGYLSPSFFKQVINEWLPSFVYPVYAGPLIIIAVTFVFIVIGYIKKKISLPELLLFLAMSYSAWQYKRCSIYAVLVCLPALIYVATIIKQKILALEFFKRYSRMLQIKIAIIAVFCAGIFIFNISVPNDIWADRRFMVKQGFPYDTAVFLNNEIKEQTTDVFNEFRWGGYLNWTVPNARLFLDGRGTATWIDNNGNNLLALYREIKYETGGLQKLDSTEAKYALIAKNSDNYPKPNFINQLIFDKTDFNKIFTGQASQLEIELENSERWKLIYEDAMARIWKKL